MCSCSKPVPPLIHTLSLHDALPIFDTIRPKIIGDKDVIHLFGKMSPRQDIQPGVLGLTRAQTLQDPLGARSEEHTSELQSRGQLVCRLLLEKKKKTNKGETYNAETS